MGLNILNLKSGELVYAFKNPKFSLKTGKFRIARNSPKFSRYRVKRSGKQISLVNISSGEVEFANIYSDIQLARTIPEIVNLWNQVIYTSTLQIISRLNYLMGTIDTK